MEEEVADKFLGTMLKKNITATVGKMNISDAVIPKRLQGKVAIVTASTDGIGYQIARRLGLEGASVVISSRKAEHVESAKKRLQQERIDVEGMVCNVTNSTNREQLIEKTVSTYGRLDILVSNAGTNICFGPILECNAQQWDKMFDTNIKSHFFLAKEAAMHLKSTHGRIIFMSSIAGYVPLPGLGVYSITKTALLSLTKVLAVELASDGITVNCVAPGIIKTKFSSALTEGDYSTRITDITPLGRVGTTEDVAPAVAFLASDEARYITGETIVIAGGMTSRL